jgi:hypothetical protein
MLQLQMPPFSITAARSLGMFRPHGSNRQARIASEAERLPVKAWRPGKFSSLAVCNSTTGRPPLLDAPTTNDDQNDLKWRLVLTGPRRGKMMSVTVLSPRQFGEGTVCRMGSAGFARYASDRRRICAPRRYRDGSRWLRLVPIGILGRLGIRLHGSVVAVICVLSIMYFLPMVQCGQCSAEFAAK